MSSTIDEKDVEINRLKEETLKKDLKIRELESVVAKLRCVLDQNTIAIAQDVKSPSAGSSSKNNKFTFKRSKKHGVSAEAWSSSKPAELVYYSKEPEVRKVLKEALQNNMMLCHLDPRQMTEMINCMKEVRIAGNSNVIEENSEATNLYVLQSGSCDVFKDRVKIAELGPATTFGELALLYKCKRTATVKATSPCVVWALDRVSFQTIMRKTCRQRQEELMSFLKNVPILKSFSENKLNKLSDLLELYQYKKDECILREGSIADCFFIIQSGSVYVTQKIPKTMEEIEIRKLKGGDFFGEKALLRSGVRTASVYASEDKTEVLCLYRKGFVELIGDIHEVKNQDYGDEARFKDVLKAVPIVKLESIEAYKPVTLSEVKRIKTLGIGGFGRVYLARIDESPRSYALKCMKKSHIVKMKQQSHVMSEKNILQEIKCQYVCRLYQTFKDKSYIYMLMEVCLGGELWSILRDRVFFLDNTTRFCLSNVIEAFEYLHKNYIIYRDLKPENLLVSHLDGYLKLCDFGFAKKLVSGKKTWTFCGTPEYVSPEIILNRSHDSSTDLWSLGILTYELLTGMPPFTAADPMKIYAMTLKGVESLDMNRNKRISGKAASFITHLCQKNAHERLGYGKNGLDDVRNHKYFQGFDWEKLRQRKVPSPFTSKVKDEFDGSNFDNYPDDEEEAIPETSGWDQDF